MKISGLFHLGHPRQPAVADAFYPADAGTLARMVDSYIEQGRGQPTAFPKALIAPHAGYIYSGPIAGSAFKQWRQQKDKIRRVVLFGPSHYAAFSGLALSRYASWDSPLGTVPVDREAIDKLGTLHYVRFYEPAHENEHCLEVELAFLQRLLKDFTIVPVVTGDADIKQVSEAMALLWGGPETVFVISSDLSHYYDYPTACRLDRATADAIESLQPKDIEPHQACGRLAIQGLLHVAEQKKMQAATTDLRNSGDTAGRKDRVVGYGAFAFREAAPA